eukprot:CFRG4574T1
MYGFSSNSRPNASSGKEGSALEYGKSVVVLYASDGRRWTALREKEHPFSKESMLYTRLVKKASHPRTDICFVKALNEGSGFVTGLLGKAKDLVAKRDPRDPRVFYGDLVMVCASIGSGHYLRATTLIGWCQFSQTKPDIGKTCKGENVFAIKGTSPGRSEEVCIGDSIVLESAKYPGYYVGTQSTPRGIYCRLTSTAEKAHTTIFKIGWSPNQHGGSGINPFVSTKDIGREEDAEAKKRDAMRQQNIALTAHSAVPSWAVKQESSMGSNNLMHRQFGPNDQQLNPDSASRRHHGYENRSERPTGNSGPPQKPSHAAPMASNSLVPTYNAQKSSCYTSHVEYRKPDTHIHDTDYTYNYNSGSNSRTHQARPHTRTPPPPPTHDDMFDPALTMDTNGYDSPFENSYVHSTAVGEDAYSRPYDNSEKESTDGESASGGWSEWGASVKKTLNDRVMSSATTAATDRYTSDPSVMISDAKHAADSPFLRSVMQTVAKKAFDTTKTG